jgi:hypothetical protein
MAPSHIRERATAATSKVVASMAVRHALASAASGISATSSAPVQLNRGAGIAIADHRPAMLECSMVGPAPAPGTVPERINQTVLTALSVIAGEPRLTQFKGVYNLILCLIHDYNKCLTCFIINIDTS